MSPGTAFTIIGLMVMASALIPFFVTRRWGWQAGAVAVFTGAAALCFALIADGLNLKEALEVAAIPTFFWMVGAAIGAAFKKNGPALS